MPTLETWMIFLPAALLLGISPGPGVLYVLSRSLAQGRRAGYASAAGLMLGGLVHVVAAAAGLSALFLTSPSAYLVVKYLGAAYLIFLGLQTLLSGQALRTPDRLPPPRPLGRIVRQGVLVETLNPKTALFFLALLPQFVDPALGSTALQMLILGIWVPIINLPVDLAVAAGGSGMMTVLATRAWVQRLQAWVSGSILVALGLRVALDER